MDTSVMIKKIAPILEREDVAYLGVFGSAARGDDTTESDLDLLVRFAKPKSLLAHIHLEQCLSDALKKKVDLVTERGLSPYIRPHILHDLRDLYGTR